jgi:hypothetical protein
MAKFLNEKTSKGFDISPTNCMNQAIKNNQPRMVNYLLNTYKDELKDTDCHFQTFKLLEGADKATMIDTIIK